MNRYEEVLRQNISRNLLRLSSNGFEEPIKKSFLTGPEKALVYKSQLSASEISGCVNRFGRLALSDGFATHARLTPDVHQKFKKVLEQQASTRNGLRVELVSPNEILKAKNWDPKNPQKNHISFAKIALIRDWLNGIQYYKKYYSVQLDEDERFYSVVDFLTRRHSDSEDLQTRKKHITIENGRELEGDYWLFRRSLSDPSYYVKATIAFSVNNAGRQSYTLSGRLFRGDTEMESIGEGYCLYSMNCFMLTGRYSLTLNNQTMSVIDHYVLHDDFDNSVLEGIWNTIYLSDKQPRSVPVALFQKSKNNDYAEIRSKGRFDELPKEISKRLRKARKYMTK